MNINKDSIGDQKDQLDVEETNIMQPIIENKIASVTSISNIASYTLIAPHYKHFFVLEVTTISPETEGDEAVIHCSKLLHETDELLNRKLKELPVAVSEHIPTASQSFEGN